MDDKLGNLNIFQDAGGSWEKGGDGFRKLLSGLEEDVGGGGRNSNERDVVGGCEPDLCDECLGDVGFLTVLRGPGGFGGVVRLPVGVRFEDWLLQLSLS